MTRCTPIHSVSLTTFLSQASASRASCKFFFLSYLLMDRNTVFAVGGIISSLLSLCSGKSKALKFNDGYRTEGRLLLKLVKVDTNVSAVKLLFTSTVSARPAKNNNDNDDVYFYSAISTKKPIALYSINNNSKPLNIYKLKINETKYKFKYTLNIH